MPRNSIDRGNAPDMEPLFPGHAWLSAWDSPEAFGRYVGGIDRKQAWHGGGWESDNDRDSWAGTKSMEEALDLAAGNWKQGRELIDKVTSAVKLAYPMRKLPIRYGVVGSVPSVPRAVAGDPQNMRIPDLQRSKKKTTITLISDMSANWSVGAENFVARAAVLAALIDNIETMGWACEVIAVAHSRGSGTVCTAVRIKESHQPLDLARAAFGLGHPAMFRRMIFADWGGNKENHHLGYGLGHCSQMEVTSDTKHIYWVPNLEGVIQHYFQDEATAVKHGLHLFTEALTIQGCPVFKDKVDIERLKYYEKAKGRSLHNEDENKLYWRVRKFEAVTGEKPKKNDWW